MVEPTSIDQYIDSQPAEARPALAEIRAAIRAAAPDAAEGISYKIPTFKVGGRALVWFAAFKRHYSLYPYTDLVRERLGAELEPHIAGKGTLRFDAAQPIPVDLIKRIVAVRLEEAEDASRRR